MDKYSKEYWIAELNRAIEVREDFFKEAAESISVYRGEYDKIKDLKSPLKDFVRKINIWSFVVNTLLPAYYARKPEIECDLRNEREQAEFLLAALIGEAAARYQLEEENEIYKTLYHFVSQYALTGFGALWCSYRAEIEKEKTEEGELSKVVSERVVLESLCYDDYLCSEARKFDEVRWQARRAFLNEEEAEVRFGEEKIKDIDFNLVEELKDKHTREKDEETSIADKAAFYEIYCHESKQTYWVNLGVGADTGELLEQNEPPVNVKSFVPCSVLIANQSPNSVIPVSDYTLNKDSIIEVERLTGRIHACIEAVRSNFLYDATLGDSVASLFVDDFKGYPVTNQALTGLKLSESIEFLNPSPYVMALKEFIAARQEAENKVFEGTHTSDLMRGVTDPRETAKAQTLKHNYSSLGFDVRQRQIAEAIEKAYNIMGEIITENFSEETIFQTTNPTQLIPLIGKGNQQQAQTPQMPPQENPLQMIFDAISILKSDFTRRFSIRIKTDSMIMFDEGQNKQERLELLGTCGSIFEKLSTYAQQMPEAVDGLKELFRFAIRSFRGHKEVEPPMMAMFDAVKNRVMQPQQQQPNPDMIKFQNESRKIALDENKFSFDQWLKQQELILSGEKIKIEGQKVYSAQQVEAMRSELEKMKTTYDTIYKARTLEIEDKKVTLSESEKLMEEQRLSSEREDRIFRDATDERRHQEKLMANANKGKAKRVQVKRTPDGLDGIMTSVE